MPGWRRPPLVLWPRSQASQIHQQDRQWADPWFAGWNAGWVEGWNAAQQVLAAQAGLAAQAAQEAHKAQEAQEAQSLWDCELWLDSPEAQAPQAEQAEQAAEARTVNKLIFELDEHPAVVVERAASWPEIEQQVKQYALGKKFEDLMLIAPDVEEGPLNEMSWGVMKDIAELVVKG